MTMSSSSTSARTTAGSSFTSMTRIGRSGYFSAKRCMSDSSSRQVGHQLAVKFTQTGLPRSAARSVSSPATPATFSSGARLPTATPVVGLGLGVGGGAGAGAGGRRRAGAGGRARAGAAGDRREGRAGRHDRLRLEAAHDPRERHQADEETGQDAGEQGGSHLCRSVPAVPPHPWDHTGTFGWRGRNAILASIGGTMSLLRRATDRLLPPTPPPGGAPPTPPPAAPGSAGPSEPPSPTPSASVEVAVTSRVVIPALKIDLPIVAQSYGPGQGSSPLGDVAQYLEIFKQPSQRGTTYIYAQAREGMFLPLLLQSQRDNGQAMIGGLVQVYTSDGHVYLYEIYRVKRHATDFSLAEDVPEGEQGLILQTSEGPRGTIPKLQIAAKLLNVAQASLAEANPTPYPRDCR